MCIKNVKCHRCGSMVFDGIASQCIVSTHKNDVQTKKKKKLAYSIYFLFAFFIYYAKYIFVAVEYCVYDNDFGFGKVYYSGAKESKTHIALNFHACSCGSQLTTEIM